MPKPRSARPRRGPNPRNRARLVARLWAASEAQVAEIEARLAALAGDPASLERDAKTLAVIARTLRDLNALDAETGLATAKPRPEEVDHAGNPVRSLEGFRAELAQRLAALRGGGPGGSAAEQPEP